MREAILRGRHDLPRLGRVSSSPAAFRSTIPSPSTGGRDGKVHPAAWAQLDGGAGDELVA